MTDSVASSSGSPRPKRRRLLSRRELRRRGTHIVRVGSANHLQATRGPYRFTSTASATASPPEHQQHSLSPEDPPPLPIEEGEADAHIDRSSASADEAPTTPNNLCSAKANTTPRRVRVMHRLTCMSEKARRLRVSPDSKRLGGACPLLMPLPPPVMLSRPDDILSSSPTGRLSSAGHGLCDITSFSQDLLLPTRRMEPPALRLADTSVGTTKLLALPLARTRDSRRPHLTSLLDLREKLKPAKAKPAPRSIIKRPK
ncbi:hypothetical protein GGH95_006392 [Coemansia sp. RSA 1836]|nr:hypothetical protein GGH95_006392 [Coemansia sp. RSA 1836]